MPKEDILLLVFIPVDLRQAAPYKAYPICPTPVRTISHQNNHQRPFQFILSHTHTHKPSMNSASIRQVLHIPNVDSHRRISTLGFVGPHRSHHEQHINHGVCKLITISKIYGEISTRNKNLMVVPKASPGKNVVNDEDDGVSLGTMKLPLNTDLNRFESLLFQWANSLCQGAMLPLPVPLKVDKISGGARLGFITIGDAGNTEVLVYIDCLVFPATDGSAPIFRAIRNGPTKDQSPPGEARIMKSLLGALQKSVEIARVL